MTDDQDQEEAKESPKKRATAKKAVKKTAKKAAKKAAKRVTKKAAKKVAKKAASKKAVKDDLELPLSFEDEQDEEDQAALDEATRAKELAHEAAEAAAKAAAAAQEAAERAAEMAKKAAAKKAAKKAATEKVLIEEARDEEASQPEREAESGKIESTEASETKRREPREKRVREVAPPPPPPEVPDEVDLNDFRDEPLADLYDEVERLPVRIPNQVTRASLVHVILGCYATHGTKIVGKGVFEKSRSNHGMLREASRSFRPSVDDLFVPAEIISQYGLREGQELEVELREPQRNDKFLPVGEVLSIDGQAVADYEEKRHFDDLTSLFPEERFLLEGEDDGNGLATRVVDLIAPLGKGQRGLIVAPPRGGKTILLKQIAKSIQKNDSEAELLILLLDERPEEVTDFEEMVSQGVYASTFDESSKRHAEVANLVLERARRLVELGKDVVILLDSLTRLARGYNNAARGGPIGSGGVSPKAITETRKFFGAARNIEEGGSLTILATCLVETESRMDDVIFEELKGTGNMEVRLDRELAESRIYPAIHIPQSGTRNDDRLYHPDELPRVQEVRRHLASLPVGESIQILLQNLVKTESNTEFLLKGMR